MRTGALPECAIVGSILTSAALGLVLGVFDGPFGRSDGFPSRDLYAYSYQNFLYAQRALAQGHGLFWNDLLSAGQPFFGRPSMGILYPPSAIFLGTTPRAWLLGQTILHLAIAGAGSYALGRVLGLRPTASLCGALAFQLGGTGIVLAGWTPIHHGAYVWMPAALACTERMLRAPGPGTCVLLGSVLSLQLLAGFPQTAVFTWELIGLRVLFELATRRSRSMGRSLSWLAGALALTPILAAAELLPMIDVFESSIRTFRLSETEIYGFSGPPSWEAFRHSFGSPRLVGNFAGLFSVVTVVLAGSAFGRHRRLALFYFGAGALFLLLVFETPLRDAYWELPVVGQLRSPSRFAWVTGFCLSVLVALGVDGLARRTGDDVRVRALALTGAALAPLGLWLVSALGLSTRDWLFAASTLAVCAVLTRGGRLASLAGAGLVVFLMAHLSIAGARSTHVFLPDEGPLRESAPALAFIDKHRAPNDRVYALPSPARVDGDLSMLRKTPSLYGLPSPTDYEPLTSRTYAEYFQWMTNERPMDHASQWLHGAGQPPRNKPLFDLLAVSWVVSKRDRTPPFVRQLRQLWSDDTLRVSYNPTALPRAFYTPRAIVVDDATERLARLASREHDPRKLALLDTAPADGFLGRAGGEGRAEIERALSEELVVEVEATQPGFLFLSDQHAPGWSAQVDGEPVPILRANHAFRLVRVPAGPSTVTFRYRPRSVRLGAAISTLGITAISVGGLGWRFHRRRQDRLHELGGGAAGGAPNLTR